MRDIQHFGSSGKLPSLRKNAVYNSLGSILSVIFPLITYPYVTRVLQPENLGKVNFSSSFIGYFSLIAVLGLTPYASRTGVKYRDDPEKLNQFCGELLTVNLLTTIVAYLALGIVLVAFPKFRIYAGLIAIYSTTILFSTLGMEWLYTLHEDFLYITIRSLVFQLLSLILVFCFVKNENDFYIYASINVLAGVGGNIFNYIYSRKYIRHRLVFDVKIFHHLKKSVVFFAKSIASSIYSNIDITMLGLMSGEFSVGIYSVAVKIYAMLQMGFSAIMSVMIPRFSYYAYAEKRDEFNSVMTKLVKTMMCLVLPAVVGINIVCPDVIMLFAGSKYLAAIPALRILSVSVLFSVLASISSIILLAHEKEKSVMVATVTAALVNIVLNLLVIPRFQQSGAAATTVLAELVVFLICHIKSRKIFRIKNFIRCLLTVLIGCAVMFGVGISLTLLINNIFARIIVTVITCIIVYFAILLLTKNEIAVEYGTILKTHIKKLLVKK